MLRDEVTERDISTPNDCNRLAAWRVRSLFRHWWVFLTFIPVLGLAGCLESSEAVPAEVGFREQLADGLCAYGRLCEPGSAPIDFEVFCDPWSAAETFEFFEPLVTAEHDVRFDPDAARTCIAEVRRAADECTEPGVWGACADVFAGMLPEGAPCDSTPQCASDLYCDGADSSESEVADPGGGSDEEDSDAEDSDAEDSDAEDSGAEDSDAEDSDAAGSGAEGGAGVAAAGADAGVDDAGASADEGGASKHDGWVMVLLHGLLLLPIVLMGLFSIVSTLVVWWESRKDIAGRTAPIQPVAAVQASPERARACSMASSLKMRPKKYSLVKTTPLKPPKVWAHL